MADGRRFLFWEAPERGRTSALGLWFYEPGWAFHTPWHWPASDYTSATRKAQEGILGFNNTCFIDQ
jgi:hypothetical protein